MNDSVAMRLPVHLLRPGTRFFLGHTDAAGISVQEMLTLLSRPGVNLDCALAVTPAKSLYVNHRGDPGWYLYEGPWPTYVQEPKYLLPIPAHTEDPGFGLQEVCFYPTEQSRSNGEGGGQRATEGPVWSETTADVQEEHAWGHGHDENAFVRLETLPQYDYQRQPRAPACKKDLRVPYRYVSLLSAICESGVDSPDEPAFAKDVVIGAKLSIRLGIKRTQAPSTCFFSKQYRVRSEGTRQPITRAKLAKYIAQHVHEYMDQHRVEYKGRVIAFEDLYLKAACLRSKGTIQPVLCVRPSTAGIPQVTLRSAQ
ncbi:hypothetical protein VTO73DRAFT_7332 [Trametes versicolor]